MDRESVEGSRYTFLSNKARGLHTRTEKKVTIMYGPKVKVALTLSADLVASFNRHKDSIWLCSAKQDSCGGRGGITGGAN